ncbi:MAG: hypothetical protein AAGJ54_06150 [Planctomycetota bacterium]
MQNETPRWAMCCQGEFFAAAIAAVTTCIWLGLFSSRFENGATLSGLNQDGGGPGFLILVSTGVIYLLYRKAFLRSLGPLTQIAVSFISALLGGFLLAGLLSLLPVSSRIDQPPIISAFVGAAFVPRVVAAVLAHSWASADAEPVSQTAA